MKHEYYIPMQINAHAFVRGMFPENTPGMKFEYYKTQEDALKRLSNMKANANLLKNGLGPSNDQNIACHQFHALYRVMVPQRKADAIENSKSMQEVGEAGIAELDPHDIRDMHFYVGEDVLHQALKEPVQDKSLDHETIKMLMEPRVHAIEDFADRLQQTKEPLSAIDMHDDKTRSTLRQYFASDGIVSKNPHPVDLEQNVIKNIALQVRSKVEVRSLAQMPDMFAEFQARLDAQPSGISDVERVAIAMDGTLDIMAASAPPTAVPIMQSIQDNVRGVVNDINADIEGRVEGYDDLSSTEREFAKPYLQRVPDEDKDMFKADCAKYMKNTEDSHDDMRIALAMVLHGMEERRRNMGDKHGAELYSGLQESLESLVEEKLNFDLDMEDIGDQEAVEAFY